MVLVKSRSTMVLVKSSSTMVLVKSSSTMVLVKSSSTMVLVKIIPIHKSGDIEEPTNFRPINLLPILSKILEKVTSTQ